jgi:catechol 2,3-dioxygenase-like lactoylglutathione lyase family enzyme
VTNVSDSTAPGSPPTEPSAGVVNHVGHCVTDLDRATAFYCEVLGFGIERDLTVPDQAVEPLLGVAAPVGLTARYLRLGDFVLELMQFERPGNPPWAERRFNEPGLTHLSVSVDDLDASVELAEAHGCAVTFRSPQVAMLRDPDGQFIELLPLSYRRRLAASS